MAQLNIAERRVPQDGRIKAEDGSRVIDFRVSTLPVLFGEKIVLRILDKGNLTLDPEDLRLRAQVGGRPPQGYTQSVRMVPGERGPQAPGDDDRYTRRCRGSV